MATSLEPLEGKYEILEKIREGGMGSVYKVRHRLLDELRVVKVMRPQLAEDEVLKARFLREAKVAIRLHHPNLAQIYDFTVDESGYAYLVMEFIDGLNLQEVIKVLERPAPGMMLEVADQSLDAIGYLHRKRIIHRDISPDNLLITRDDDRKLQVKLIDLGIAKDREVEDSLTSAGTFLGKVRYSSPEHFRTHEGAQVGVRSDLYSFGVVLYEMLTGTYPIRGSSVASLISGHLMHPPLEFEASDPDGVIPDGLREIVMKALAKQVEDRFDTAASFRAALAPFREKLPVEDEQLRTVFEIPTLTTRRIKTIKPGSTQSRIDRSFGVSTTPPPGEITDEDDELESSGTVETGSQGRGRAVAADHAVQSQIRALLLGAGKLIEGKHYDEARLQLATVLELAPDNADAKKLQRTVEAADIKMQQRRQRAADGIRQAILAEQYDRAATQLEGAVETLGTAELFDRLRADLEEARERHAKKQARLEKIESETAELVAAERFEEALELVREGLSLAPGHRGLKAMLSKAEAGRTVQIEASRRAREIEDTAAKITAQIERAEADGAERALQVAVKLYGEQEVFGGLRGELGQLRDRLRLEKAETLRRRARELIAGSDFSAAVETLEQAHEIAPEAAETDDLLAAAREGLRLEEESRQRSVAIDETVLQVDRLILAGRLESAVRVVDAAVETLGDFEQASVIRDRIIGEKESLRTRKESANRAIERALALSADDDFTNAQESLEEARRLAEGLDEIEELLAETEAEVQRRIEAHRRQLAIGKVIQSISRQLEKAAVAEARRELAVAQRLYGSSDALDELAAAIDARERGLRREEVEGLIAKALEKGRRFEDVITDLEAAAALDPSNEKAQRLLAETRTAHRRFLDEQTASRAEAALDEIDRLIAAGEIAVAIKALDRATAELGDFRAARLLRSRLTDLA